MKTMLKYEIFIWMRSKKLLAIIYLFIVFALLSVISNYFIKDIISSISNDASIAKALPEPTYETMMNSFFKNSAQICFLFATYLMCKACSIGNNRSKQSYYRANLTYSGSTFFVKYIVSIVLVSIGYLISFIVAILQTKLLVIDLEFSVLLTAAIFQLLVMLTLLSVLVAFSVWFNAPIACTIFYVIFVFFAPLIFSFSNGIFKEIGMIIAPKIKNNMFSIDFRITIVIILISLILLSILAIVSKPFKAHTLNNTIMKGKGYGC